MDILQEIYLLEKEVERKWENKDCIVGAKKFAELLTTIVKNCNIPDVGSSDSIKETVKNFADIDMFLNDLNDEPFDEDSNSYGKVTRIANKYIIKLR